MPRPACLLACPSTDTDGCLVEGDFQFDPTTFTQLFVDRFSQHKTYRVEAYAELRRVLTDLEKLGCDCIAISGHLFHPSWPTLGNGGSLHEGRGFVVFTLATRKTTKWESIRGYIESESEPQEDRRFVEIELCPDDSDECQTTLAYMTSRARRGRIWILKHADAV